jgi:hypothetical protein
MKTVHGRLLLVCWLAACSGNTATPKAAENSTAAEDDIEDDFKGCPEDVPSVEPGLQAAGEHFAVELLAAMPAEPERYIDNSWTVELHARDGSATPDAQIVRGQTFMPVHGHDGQVAPLMKALAQPGQVQVDKLNFTMRGPWEVRLWLRSEAVAEDYVVFTICVAK